MTLEEAEAIWNKLPISERVEILSKLSHRISRPSRYYPLEFSDLTGQTQLVIAEYLEQERQ